MVAGRNVKAISTQIEHTTLSYREIRSNYYYRVILTRATIDHFHGSLIISPLTYTLESLVLTRARSNIQN